MKLSAKERIQDWLPGREPDAHKGDFGRVLVIAGSRGMMGACVLACRSAFRSGSGLVAACCPEEYFPVIHGGVPEATCVARGIPAFSKYDAVAAGPGLGTDKASWELIERLLQEFEGPAVLDADSLNCLSEYGIPSPDRVKAKMILTPHAGEAARLVNTLRGEEKTPVSAMDVSSDRIRFGTYLASSLGAVCVMKGRGSLVCGPEGSVYENTTGNAGMATGGSGDVLTGMIASLAGQLAAQNCDPGTAALRAALCGVYLHGLAGDIAAEKWGQAGMMASDLADGAALAQKLLKSY